LQNGIPAERVHVIPLGVAPGPDRDEVRPLPLPTTKHFKFLFVGGTIPRKGIDLLLQAYCEVFSASDDVCLVIKDCGTTSFYQGQTAAPAIASRRFGPLAPDIVYLAENLSDHDMTRLYAACDCLVHPFRGEGFGLPLAEAMSHGLALIVTGFGPVLEFAGPEHAYFIPAEVRRFSSKRLGDWDMADYPWWAEPDRAALAAHLRHAYAHPHEVRDKGRNGRQHIHQHFTWDPACTAVETRLAELRRRPIVRFRRSRPSC